ALRSHAAHRGIAPVEPQAAARGPPPAQRRGGGHTKTRLRRRCRGPAPSPEAHRQPPGYRRADPYGRQTVGARLLRSL
ncbi:MAG: hypothetical protein AVDCRST_MAG66-1318, partial [uncultured Pseudonocardia sp.]